MAGFIESVRASAEAHGGRPVSTGQTVVSLVVMGLAVVGWFWWMNQPDSLGKTIRVTAAEYGTRWPYAGVKEGLLWCKLHKGRPATFIRIGVNDFGTNGEAYDMAGVTSDRGLMRRAAYPLIGIDSDAGDGAQRQIEIAKTLCP